MHYDLLAKMKNGYMAKKEGFQTSYSNLNFAIAKLLTKYGFLADAQKRTVGKKQYLDIKLRYVKGKPAFENFKIISKPSRRIYSGYRELKPVRQGYGIGVLSSPTGVVVIQDCKKAKVGGEYLFQIW